MMNINFDPNICNFYDIVEFNLANSDIKVYIRLIKVNLHYSKVEGGNELMVNLGDSKIKEL